MKRSTQIRPYPGIRRWVLSPLALCVVVILTWFPSPGWTHDDSDTPPNAIVHSADYFGPLGVHDDAWNGKQVYLSSPRHASSNEKNECKDPGRQENINGRRWNWYAANGHHQGEVGPLKPALSQHTRGYKVQVSPNSRDDGYAANKTASQNWGANVHIVTHTNGTTEPGVDAPCTGVAGPFYTAWEHTVGARDDEDLAIAIGERLDPQIIGSWVNPQRTGLLELETNAPAGDAYVELQYHDHQPSQTWIFNNTDRDKTWHLGVAIDQYLDYP